MSIEEFNENYIKLCENKIELHDNINDDNIFVYVLDHITCYIFNLTDIFENNRFKYRFVYDTNIKKTLYISNCVKFTKYYCDSIVFPFLNWNHPYKNLDAFQDNIVITQNLLRANFITKIEKHNNEYYIVNYGNKKILQRILNNSKGDFRTQMFIDALYYSIKINIINTCEKKMRLILDNSGKEYDNKERMDIDMDIDVDMNVDRDIDKLLKDDIKLYEYQKEDIKWMNMIKNKIDNNENILTVDQSIFYNTTLDGVDYLLYNRTIMPNLTNVVTTKKINIQYYGGNIISEVGLGKTLVILCHIFQHNNNNFDNFIEFETEMCNYFFKRGKNKGTNCMKKKSVDNDLYCKEHSSTLFIDKRNTTFKNLDNFNLRDYIITSVGINGNTRYHFKTNASVILCPNQLCDQWVREYYDKFKQTFDVAKRVLLIVTYDQYKNLSFGDILFADLIIISYNFLLNTNYYKKTGYNNCYWRPYARKNIVQILDDLDRDDSINSIDDLLNIHHEELNLFDNYYYKGVYLDENHEIINKPRTDILQRIIKSFESDYKWNISATPFSNGVKSFINNTNLNTNCMFSYENVYNLNENMIENLSQLYRRNTRESIKNEFSGNIIKETINLLEFTEQERSIYDAHMQGNFKNNRNFLIKLCCDTSIDIETRNLVKNCKTLDEIQKVILDNNKKKLTSISGKIRNHTIRIEELLLIVDRGYVIDEVDMDGDIFENIEQVKSEIGIFRRKLTNDKKEYDTINRTYVYLKKTIDNIKETEVCPICLDDIPTDQISITKCGHKFCKECIYEFMEEINSRYDEVKCPKCNVFIKSSDIYLLKDIDVNMNVNMGNDELSRLIQKIKSTKIGNIIYYLKHKLKENDKCIIFSQWDNMLIKIGNILKQENINVLYCSGTVYQRKRAINKFQSDLKSNIICLSSENCASGINLTCANKIILIEPIYGAKEYRKDIENQAIGRADRIGQKNPIEIIRFIIKNTIEEDILNDNNKIDHDHECNAHDCNAHDCNDNVSIDLDLDDNDSDVLTV